MCDRNYLLAATVAVLLTGPLSGGDEKVPLTDAEILNRIYNGPKVPKGFYSEAHPMMEKTSVSVVWVTAFDAATQRHVPQHAADLAAARKATQAYLDKINVPSDAKKIVSESKTDQFFEFRTRHQIRDYTYWRHERVWRSDFFRPSAPLVGPGGKLGVLTAKADPKTVQWLAEFLWWSENHNLSGATVLTAPTVRKTDKGIEVTMLVGNMTFGDFGLQDMGSVSEWKLTVDGASGEVTRSVRQLRQLPGKKRAGGIRPGG